MPQVFVNDVPQDLDQTLETWGDLLDVLDRTVARDGVILSAARFDGVEETAFREPDATNRDLCSVARVDVETADEAAFLKMCLLEAVQPLQQTAASAQSLAECYRRHDLSRGQEGLTGLAAELRALALLVGTLSGPLGINLSTDDGLSVDQRVEELVDVLDALLSAQASEDWVTVADILEYDLEPAIRRWAAVLTQAAERLA